MITEPETLSTVPGIRWPAVPAPPGAALLAMQYQFEQTEWWAEEALRQSQLRQLSRLLRHAYDTIPFYRSRLEAAGYHPDTPELTSDWFSSLPLLSRTDVQSQGDALVSHKTPRDHGGILRSATSGSTGRPIRCSSTQLTGLFWQAFTLRDHLWHNRDFNGHLASIKAGLENASLQGWGPPADTVFHTGTAAGLDIRADIGEQANWLLQQDPHYLLSHPSNIEGLAEFCLKQGIRLERLRQIRTMGEVVGPELRAICRRAWNVSVVDMYSATEVGYMALQCPEHEHYHVQSEGVLLEVIDAQGWPCAPGEIGRVVVTTLHNFAMPLIRYEILDYAEVGPPCPCGRGLPVLRKIMGRQRNLLTFPDGRKNWPRIGYKHWLGVVPIEQAQLVQRSLEEIEARLVTARPLTSDEEQKLTTILRTSLGYPFRISFSYHQEIPRSPSGKFEDFLSEVRA